MKIASLLLASPRLLLMTMLCFSPMLLVACQKNTQPSPETRQAPGLNEAILEYHRRNYQSAYDQSVNITLKATGLLKAEAQLIAGLSAYRMGKSNDALRYLTPASTSSSTRISGKAHATLGLMAAGKEQFLPAQRHLTQATQQLNNRNERAEAYYQLGILQQKMGKWADSRLNLARAATDTDDSKLRRDALERAKNGAWTIQVGAFSTEKLAKDKAQEYAKLASQRRAGGTYVVVGLTPKSKLLYLVRIGKYADLATARTMKNKLGLKDTFITTVKVK